MPTVDNASRYSPILDYAVIGDCRSVALISREGSLDWLCWPEFDSPSVFAAVLDANRGGRFSIRPEGPFRAERRYLPDTNTLETVFHAPEGSVALRDLMPVTSEDRKREQLIAEHEILRVIEGVTGEVELRIHYEPRPDYARRAAKLENRGQLGVWCQTGHGVLVLRCDVPLGIDADMRSASVTIRICAGERKTMSLSYSDDGPAVTPAIGAAARQRLEESDAWWRAWTARCTYEGPYRESVVRSLLALKLMCFAPSGAIVAAPTTSLPELIGGVRNWDYRYCWLRDASFTLRALTGLGYEEEAAAYCGWLLHATRLSWPRLQILYGIYGETRVTESTLGHLEGYAGSSPVRIGNGAHSQQQLDVYGEVVDAIARMARSRDFFDGDTVRFLNGIGKTVCDQWREPDSGIWEPRSSPMHYTHSKVLCWVALDRLIDLHETYGLDLDVDRFRTERDAIRVEVERRGYNARIGSYTQTLDGSTLDASLLTLPWYGYIDAAHPRIMSTLKRVGERLGRGGLMYRYDDDTDDGFDPGEGAFGVCGFWAVDCRARGGQLAVATEDFERLLGYANDVGLFAEEIDPETGAALGNFPQAFTHVGVINAALTLAAGSSETAAVGKEVRG